MRIALYFAAALVVAIGIAHSYLGERYILMRLFRRTDLPKLFGSTEFTIRTLRFAWHITSVAWLGFAAILVLLTQPTISHQSLGLIIGITFFLHFLIAAAGSKGKHLSWPVFLVIAVLTVYASNI